MTNSANRSSITSVLGTLGWPLIVGSAACSVFYVLIFQGPLDLPWMHRYFASHPVAFAATGMFFIGLVSLLFKLGNVVGQYWVSSSVQLPEAPESGQPVDQCSDLLDQMEEGLSTRAQKSYFGRRIRDGLEHVERTGSVEGLSDELKYLADEAGTRQYDSYALARIIIWATPMLGFLGTVVGITQALGDLDATEMANSIDTAMEQLLSGLYIAFDTTALALTLSIVLMFVQFFIDRLETHLLQHVDDRAAAELLGRFETPLSSDPNVALIREMTLDNAAMVREMSEDNVSMVRVMTEEVVQSSELLAQRQAEIWQSTISAAHEQWSSLVHTAGGQIEHSLAEAIQTSLADLTTRMSAINQQTAANVDQQWERWQHALRENSRMIESQQQAIASQNEVMSQAITATHDILKLEQALNQNLKTLAGANNFEETVMSLAAAIHLLNSRLGGMEGGRPVNLRSTNEHSDEAA